MSEAPDLGLLTRVFGELQLGTLSPHCTELRHLLSRVSQALLGYLLSDRAAPEEARLGHRAAASGQGSLWPLPYQSL